MNCIAQPVTTDVLALAAAMFGKGREYQPGLFSFPVAHWSSIWSDPQIG